MLVLLLLSAGAAFAQQAPAPPVAAMATPAAGRWEFELKGGEWFPTGPSARDLKRGNSFSIGADYRVDPRFSIGLRASYVPSMSLSGTTSHHTLGFFATDGGPGPYGPLSFTSNIYATNEFLGPYIKFRDRFGGGRYPFEVYSMLGAGVDRLQFNSGTLVLNGQGLNTGGPAFNNVTSHQPAADDLYFSNMFAFGFDFQPFEHGTLGVEAGYHRVWEHDNDEFVTTGAHVSYLF